MNPPISQQILELPCKVVENWTQPTNSTLDALKQTYKEGFQYGLKSASALVLPLEERVKELEAENSRLKDEVESLNWTIKEAGE